MTLKIISVGKKHDSWISNGIEQYQKRLRAPFDVEWVLLAHSTFDGPRARQEDSRRISSQLDADSFVILLDETGHIVSSPELSNLFNEAFRSSKKICIVIGGAYGVDKTVFQRADYVWSFSKLVFPHQLVRLILTEQIYRAQEITLNKPYHHS